jgi:hypothetical protein
MVPFFTEASHPNLPPTPTPTPTPCLARMALEDLSSPLSGNYEK